ncbi:MAG: hypothetical protein NTW10_11490 [Bacteroidetes bacterium]|nr:hypothetical protein [Bacteroidota bacterium]
MKMENQKAKKTWKQKLFHEFSEYLVNFIYMAIFFSAVVFYRRLVLAQHGIVVEDYFAGVIKAFVIAKVVMIGAFLRISRKFENKPLIIPSLYKAILFTIWVMLFDMLEMLIKGFIQSGLPADALTELKNQVNAVWFGAALMIFVSFIPFFAFKELSRVLGRKKIQDRFFKVNNEQENN